MSIEYRKGRDFGLSVECISKPAYEVIKTLQKSGYQSYIVGGGVRDLLLNKQPKDFDIATAAHPGKIRRLFKRCRLVGKRFRLAHVFHKGQLLEVATFRAEKSDNEHKNISVKNWCTVADNRYGTLEEDVTRRDFTINAMYYDPCNDKLICHPHAISDIENKYLRIIGDPLQRYREDPVRILRGLRLANKLNLTLEQDTAKQIIPNRRLLLNIPSARLFDECKKLFCCGASLSVFEAMKQFQLLELLFPQTFDAIKTHPEATAFECFLSLLFSDTDKRIALAEPVTPAFTIAGLWWLPTLIKVGKKPHERLHHIRRWERKIDEITLNQNSHISIPKYMLRFIFDIYKLQPHFTRDREKNINNLIGARRFRAAYDFFGLLAKAGLADIDTYRWWKTFQQVNQKQRDLMISDRVSKHPTTKPRRNKHVEAKC